MNDQNDERMERRGKAGQHSVQSEEKGSNRMLRDGLEIFSYSPKTVVTFGLLAGVIGLCVSAISFYQRLGAEIHNGISNDKELNQRLDRTDWNMQDLKDKTEKFDERITDVEKYINSKGKR